MSDGYKEMAMSREHWDAKRDAEIANLKARLAEANDLNVVRRTAMVNLHEHIEGLQARLAEAERERDALRAVAQQFLADYHSADGMASYKQYAHEFRTALTADSAAAQESESHE